MESEIYLDISRAQKTTMTWLFDEYQKEYTSKKKGFKQEISMIGMLKHRFGEFTVAGLKPADIIEYAKERRKSVLSDTVRRELAVLSAIINTGMSIWGLKIPANPCKEAKAALTVTKTLVPGNERERRLTKDELTQLLKSPDGNLFEFAIETAMRRGEIAGMTRANRDGNTLFIPFTKNGKARTIGLSPRAMEILDALPADIDENKRVWGLSGPDMTARFEKARGNIEDLRFHDLRHEATSRLEEQHNLTPAQIAQQTGHKDGKMVGRYTHLLASDIAAQLAS